MTYALKLGETKFYISTQDGPLDNREFDSWEEAEAVRLSLQENLQLSTCVREKPNTKRLLTE